jgi:SAM-dependent methyltransferase
MTAALAAPYPRRDARDMVAADATYQQGGLDGVINVEASHAYPQLSRFLGEVARVLRPGGHFLYADFRGRNEFPAGMERWADMPLRQLPARVINADVVRSLDKNSQRSLELIGRCRRSSGRSAGVPGTGLYRLIENGHAQYRMYCFAKD